MRDSDKMYAQAKQLERKLEKMDKLDKPVYENQKLKLKAKQTKRTGNDAIIAEGLSKSFGNVNLFNNLDLNVYFRDSIAILGDNGCGKSTLLKILLNKLDADAGSIKHGSNLHIGYIAQNIEFSAEQKSIVDYFQYKYNINSADARRELAKVLFFGDDVFKKIDVLSGGEKSRLRLCCLMYENVNLMVLDEPTNHLDIESREILEDILTKYDGTIVFVSHDRYFIKKVAKQIAAFEDKKLSMYKGNYDYYKEQVAKRQEEQTAQLNASAQKKEKTVTKHESTIRANEIDRIQKKLSSMEAEISSIEEIIKEVDVQMLKNGDDLDQLMELEQTKSTLVIDLEVKIEKWEALTKELEHI